MTGGSKKISQFLIAVYSERRQQPTLPGWLLLTGTLERCSATVTRRTVRRRRGPGPTPTAPPPTTTDPPPSQRYCQYDLWRVDIFVAMWTCYQCRGGMLLDLEDICSVNPSGLSPFTKHPTFGILVFRLPLYFPRK